MRILFRFVELVAVAVVAVVAISQMMGWGPMRADPSDDVQLALPQIDQEAVVVVTREMEFQEKRAQILSEIRSLETSGKWQDVQMAARPWLDMKDADIEKQYNRARERDLVAQARRLPASELERNLELYATLVSINPGESRYQRKRDRYEGLIAKRFGELDPRPKLAASLCRGTLRAHGMFLTSAALRAVDTTSQAQANGDVDVAMNVVSVPTEGEAEAYQARCKVLPDRTVEVERFRQL